MNSSTKFLSLSSGSCGNCYYISLEENSKHVAGVMIDTGISARKVKNTLLANKIEMDSFESILVTHEHADHTRGLGSMCKQYHKNIYSTPTIHGKMATHYATRDWVPKYRKDLQPNTWNEIVPGKIFAKYFVVPHDAAETVGYALWLGSHKLTIMTDIGHMTDEALAFARNSETVVIESNYDEQMLMNGSYPYELKVRVAGDNGHMSNDDCARAIIDFYHPGLKNIFLCHRSADNNTEEKALEASSRALQALGFTQAGPKPAVFVRKNAEGEEEIVKLHVLPRDKQSVIFGL